ncbi:hypothetical protein [Erwinia mallotivora]|uniref:hypothetical protein n=1 Tax=Erwinia mallotivora TaxID=69222 RepID=UPI0021BE1A0F|nr:hypothetical protein [Erwinia mallotivora]
MILRAMTLFLMLISSMSYAFEKCIQRTSCDNTTLGKLEYVWGQYSNDKKSHVTLNGNNLLTVDGSQIGREPNGDGFILDKNNNISKVIFYYYLNTPKHIKTDPRYGDLYRYVEYRLFDFSGKEVVISNEFYPPADYDAPLGWVSWGQKNSVITFKDGSRFKYEKGHVTMIDSGESDTSENKQ